MTKSIFEKITLDTTSNKAISYAHSSTYAKKRATSNKNKKSYPSIKNKKLSLQKLLG